jgi:hypothetical protein
LARLRFGVRGEKGKGEKGEEENWNERRLQSEWEYGRALEIDHEEHEGHEVT